MVMVFVAIAFSLSQLISKTFRPEHKRLESALQKSEERFQTFISSAYQASLFIEIGNLCMPMQCWQKCMVTGLQMKFCLSRLRMYLPIQITIPTAMSAGLRVRMLKQTNNLSEFAKIEPKFGKNVALLLSTGTVACQFAA